MIKKFENFINESNVEKQNSNNYSTESELYDTIFSYLDKKHKTDDCFIDFQEGGSMCVIIKVNKEFLIKTNKVQIGIDSIYFYIDIEENKYFVHFDYVDDSTKEVVEIYPIEVLNKDELIDYINNRAQK